MSLNLQPAKVLVDIFNGGSVTGANNILAANITPSSLDGGMTVPATVTVNHATLLRIYINAVASGNFSIVIKRGSTTLTGVLGAIVGGTVSVFKHSVRAGDQINFQNSNTSANNWLFVEEIVSEPIA